jgi:hypothetical protein
MSGDLTTSGDHCVQQTQVLKSPREMYLSLAGVGVAMLTRFCTLLTCLVFAFAPSGRGQEPSAATPSILPLAPTVVPAGTKVQLRTMWEISSNSVHEGGRAELEVARDVKVGDLLVIPRHARAIAVVTRAQQSRNLLRGGSLALKIENATAITGDLVPLRATIGAQGGPTLDDKVDAIPAIIFTWPLFARKGDEAILRRGTWLDAQVDRDFSFDAVRLAESIAAFEAKNAAALVAARTGKTTVLLYNDLEKAKNMVELDGRPFARVSQGYFVKVQLLRGKHTFRYHKSKSEVTLDFEPDKAYYLRLQGSGFWTKHLDLVQVSNGQGEDQIFGLTEQLEREVFAPLPH